MTHRIKAVKTLKDCVVAATFFDGTVKEYDIKCLYSVFPQFRIFETDRELFEKVQVDQGGYGISWNDELDMNADDIWENGRTAGKDDNVDIVLLFAQQLANARDRSGLTQKSLAEITGIHQADISKIERGIGNPSLMTLKRLADGMGMDLKLELVQSL